MAGLLDIFGSGGTSSLGLLGMSPEDISQARNDAQAQALYALAGSLLQGGQSTGASIAKGLQMGQQAYRSAMQNELQDRMGTFQLQDVLRKRKLEEEALARQQMIDAAVARAYQPAKSTIEYQRMTPQQLERAAEPGFEVPQTTTVTPARFDFKSLAPALMASREGRATLADLMKAQELMQPKLQTLKEGEQIGYMQDGKFVEVANLPKQKALKEVDLGNVVVMLDDTGKEVMRFSKGRAPEGPVALQHVETEQGIATFNPRTGQLTPVMQGGKPVMGKGAGNLTESQGNATTFGMRMAEAHKTLTALEGAGLKNTGMLRSGISGTVGAVPLIGESMSKGVDNVFNVLPSIMGGLNESQQSTLQARVNFITAVLRKESGASISPSEFATAEKNYFPAPGDSEKIIAQKQKAREMAIKGMKLQAGPGAKYIGQETDITSSGW